MLPTPQSEGADENAPPGSQNNRRLPFSYEKLVEMAKRVGVAQTQKARGKKADRATTVITEGSVRVIGRKAEEGAMPLLHAAINTVICTLISKRTGVAVIVAHTWDGRGNRGIGCDVVRLKPKGCGAFKAAIQSSIDALNRRNAEARTNAAPAEIPPPYTPGDATPAPSYTPSVPRNGRLQRRRSTLAENEADGEYLLVEDFLGADYDEPDDLNFDDDDTNVDDLSPSTGYMDVFGQTNNYLDISPARDFVCSVEPPAYEPHPFAARA